MCTCVSEGGDDGTRGGKKYPVNSLKAGLWPFRVRRAEICFQLVVVKREAPASALVGSGRRAAAMIFYKFTSGISG